MHNQSTTAQYAAPLLEVLCDSLESVVDPFRKTMFDYRR